MLITPADAATKWCPASRIASQAGNTNAEPRTNRGTDIDPANCNCLGPACMAWRWADSSKVKGFCGIAGTGMSGQKTKSVLNLDVLIDL